jgi:hypothetical protein
VPRPLFVSEGIDCRQMVPGRCDAWGLFERCKINPALTRKVGAAIGAILAEQHTRIAEADVTGWLPGRVAWPESGDWIRARLPLTIEDADFVREMGYVIQRYETVTIDSSDRVLVHGDVGLHNLALDPETDAVNGVFDYDSAAWADRHHDFRYLLFDVGRDDMLDAALEVYEPAVGRTIDRRRVGLYNAACAISFLALRCGIPAEEKSCGRTLSEDLRWVRTALAKLTG